MQDKLCIFLEGLESAWSQRIQQLNQQYARTEDDRERFRIANMLAMAFVNWVSAFGFDFALKAQSWPARPKQFAIWSDATPEINFELNFGVRSLSLSAISPQERRRLELDPGVLSTYLTELKQKEQIVAPPVDVSFAAYDAKNI